MPIEAIKKPLLLMDCRIFTTIIRIITASFRDRLFIKYFHQLHLKLADLQEHLQMLYLQLHYRFP